MQEDAPTVQEITVLTQRELTADRKDDSIRECGRAALALLPRDPDLCLKLAYQKLHDVPYKDVKTCWRRLYTDASLWKVVKLVEGVSPEEENDGDTESKKQEQGNGAENKDWVDEMVKLLDMALILTGAPDREEVVELWFSALKNSLSIHSATEADFDLDVSDRPAKRRKVISSRQTSDTPSRFPIDILDAQPSLQYPLPRATDPSLSAVQKRLGDVATHIPFIIEGAIEHWPALGERPWSDSEYLLEQTLGGRRLVPVEIGKSYTDDGWGQRILTFREFMETYMLETSSPRERDGTLTDNTNGHTTKAAEQNPDSPKKAKQTGYLAQHDLFAQIPSLRADISTPDYCYCEPAPSPHLTHIKPTAQLDEPLLNAWFGPAGTISPLHTDPYHNILAQVVGYKYVRLYAPSETEKLYPRGRDENGVDMSNTSQVDIDEGMAVWPEISYWGRMGEDNGDVRTEELENRRRHFEQQYPNFREAKYIEGILGPGECLYLPIGWWHYVRSLTPSFSVSFWFN